MSKLKVNQLETLDGSVTVNVSALASAGSGVTDHGALTGLADDDHPQYHTDARGDARYSQLGHGHAIADVAGLQTALDGKSSVGHTHAIADVAGLQTALDGKQVALVSGTNIKTINNESLLGSGNITITGGGGGVTDHGALTGLADDDHPQYHTDARGDARYSQLGHTHTASQISDSTTVGRSVLTAADAAAARAAIGAGTGNGDVTLTGTQTLTNKTISGASNTITVDGTSAVGFREIPQVSQSAAYTLVLSDSGKHILHPSADTTARTFTIPANSSVAFPIGTAITFVNQAGAGNLTIAIATDTMRLAGAGTTGSRTLAPNGVATAIKLTATEWIISGTGLT
jgi:hypothetical protein